jgi:hypothetical protein
VGAKRALFACDTERFEVALEARKQPLNETARVI